MYSFSQTIALCGAIVACIFAIIYKDKFNTIGSIFPEKTAMLSIAETKLLINTMMYTDKKYMTGQEPRKCKLAFCCSADLDVSVSAIDFMDKLDVATAPPRHYERLHSNQELHESFSFYFTKGAAAEQSMANFNDFKTLVDIANNITLVKHAVGGNAATMAQRAAIEGCNVLLGAAIGSKMKSHFHPSVKFAGNLNDDDHEDVHLVLEYSKGDEWKGSIAPRANRYYLNHDIHNAHLTALEEFEEALLSFSPDMVTIGGIQLMEVNEEETKRLQRLQELSNVLQSIYVGGTPIHYEFACVSDFTLFNDTIRLILPWVKSIGLNEQELHTLHDYLISNEQATTAKSKPTVSEVTSQLSDIIAYVDESRSNSRSSKHKEERSPLSIMDRIHFHTLQFHIICQRRDGRWSDPKSALIRSMLTATKIACGTKSEEETIKILAESVEVMLPRDYLVHSKLNLYTTIDPHDPIYSWEEGSFTCFIAPMLVCKKPDHTAGLGDNISGAAMAHHALESQKE